MQAHIKQVKHLSLATTTRGWTNLQILYNAEMWILLVSVDKLKYVQNRYEFNGKNVVLAWQWNEWAQVK